MVRHNDTGKWPLKRKSHTIQLNETKMYASELYELDEKNENTAKINV